MTKQDTLALVKDRYHTARKEQKPKFDRFSDFDFIYNNKLKHYDPNIPSKVFNPIVWSFIETIITRMLAQTPVIAYKPRDENRDESEAQIFTDLFSYWFDKCNVYPKMVSWAKDALIYGTGIVKLDWYTSKPRTVTTYIYDIDGTPMVDPATNQFVTTTSQVIDYDDVRLCNVNVYDFYIDPQAKTVQDAAWVVHQYWANIADLELVNRNSTTGAIYRPGQLEAIRKEKSQNFNEYEARRREATGLDSVQAGDTTVDRCLIWEMWENDRLIVVADGMKVLRDGPNPYWHGKKPFVYLVDSIVPNEFWGKGEIEPVEKLLHALNTTQNQRIINVNRILSPMWKAKTTVDDDELNFIDNGIIHVNDLADADMVAMKDVTSGAYTEAETIKEDMQRTLGVTDYVQGLQTPGQTAKEVETKTAQSNARFAHKVKLFQEMGLKEVGELFYQLEQQYTTKPKVIKIVGSEGEKYQTVAPQQMVGVYDVIPEDSSTLATDSQAEFNKFFNLYTALTPDAQQTIQTPMGPQTTGFLNKQELDIELLKRAGEKDYQKYFVNQGGFGDQGTGNP